MPSPPASERTRGEAGKFKLDSEAEDAFFLDNVIRLGDLHSRLWTALFIPILISAGPWIENDSLDGILDEERGSS